MVLVKQNVLELVFAFMKAEERQPSEENRERVEPREQRRLQEELRAVREKAKLFELLHRNRVF
jgi:hypothetical protein